MRLKAHQLSSRLNQPIARVPVENEIRQSLRALSKMQIDSSPLQLDPESEYRRRLGLLVIEKTQLEKRHTILGYLKLAILLAGVITAVWILATRIELIYCVLIPAILFVVVAIVHERVLQASRRCTRIIGFYERGLARLGEQWAGKGESGERFLDNSHPYSRDLDLFGSGSMFELLPRLCAC